MDLRIHLLVITVLVSLGSMVKEVNGYTSAVQLTTKGRTTKLPATSIITTTNTTLSTPPSTIEHTSEGSNTKLPVTSIITTTNTALSTPPSTMEHTTQGSNTKLPATSILTTTALDITARSTTTVTDASTEEHTTSRTTTKSQESTPVITEKDISTAEHTSYRRTTKSQETTPVITEKVPQNTFSVIDIALSISLTLAFTLIFMMFCILVVRAGLFKRAPPAAPPPPPDHASSQKTPEDNYSTIMNFYTGPDVVQGDPQFNTDSAQDYAVIRREDDASSRYIPMGPIIGLRDSAQIDESDYARRIPKSPTKDVESKDMLTSIYSISVPKVHVFSPDDEEDDNYSVRLPSCRSRTGSRLEAIL